MTSSDVTALPPDAKDRIAARVGTAIEGICGPGSAEGVRVGFACAEFNGGITDRLLTAALDRYGRAGGDPERCTVAWVPGAFELPVAAQSLVGSGLVHAVVCLGAVIRGDTGHYDFVAGECAAGLQRVQLDTGLPVVFGVLTTDTVEQALERSRPDKTNKGGEAVETALAMVSLLRRVGAAAHGSPAGFGPSDRMGA
jgi:6,7-dimethyl-8-ribityllumazine synthase